MTILVVEDDPVIGMSLLTLLTRQGYTVVGPIASGEAALPVFLEHQPDLVLLDISLAGEWDGIRTTEELQKHFAAPVIYLTAMTELAFLERARVTHPHGYLVKPVEPRELLFAIEMALYRSTMEKRLLSSEQRYREMVDNMGDGLGVIDGQGRITRINPSFARMMGYTEKELGGKDFFSLVREDHSGQFPLRRLQELAGEGQQIEFCLLRSDKRPLHVLFTPYLLHGTPGTDGQGIAFTAVDITQRKQAEDQLQKSERLTSILHLIDQGILSGKPPREVLRNVLDKTRRELFFCDRISFFFIEMGSKEGMIYAVSSELDEGMHEGDRFRFSQIQSSMNTLLQGNTRDIPDFEECRNLNELDSRLLADGMRSLYQVPVFSGTRLAGGLNVSSRNKDYFTPEMKSQVELLASEIGVLVTHSILNRAFHDTRQLNNRILELSPDTILVLEQSGRVQVSQEGQDNTLPVPEAGSNYLRFLRNELGMSAQKVKDICDVANEVLSSGRNGNIEVSFVIPGSSRTCFVEIRLVHLYQDQVLAIVRDITEAKETQARIRLAILHAQEEERKRFASNLHDGLGQLLSALSMNLKALHTSRTVSGLDDSPLFHNCMELSAEAFSEARRISHNLSPETLEAKGLVAAMEKTVKSFGQGSPIRFSFHCSGDIGRFHADAESCIFRIGQELINNITRHSFATHAWIQIGISDGCLVLEAGDDGVGFDMGAFDGLGMKNLQSRAELVSGKIRWDSAPGRGTRVTLSAPLSAIKAEKEPENSPEALLG